MPIFRGRTNIDGNLGIGSGLGTTAPSGLLHGHNGSYGFLSFRVTGVDATPVTIVPSGSLGVTQWVIVVACVAEHSGGEKAVITPSFALIEVNTTNVLMNISAAQLRLAANTDGSITLYRHSGTGTFDVTGMLMWR